MKISKTGWQQHSIRAAISRLRKAGYVIERRQSKPAEHDSIYQIMSIPEGDI